MKGPTVALTFSLGQVGPSSASRLTSCHKGNEGRCEIAGDLLASGTPVLSFGLLTAFEWAGGGSLLEQACVMEYLGGR